MKFLVTVLTIILIFGACSKDVELPPKGHFITIEQAIEFAKENRGNTLVDENKVSLRSGDFTPLNTISLDDDTETPALYIINYRSNGEDFFNIISADNRLDYVLAFGEGVIESVDIKEGLNVWIHDQIKVIQQIRSQNLTKKQVVTEVIQAKVLPENESDCCEACPNWPECEIKPWIGCGNPNIECDPCDAINNLTIVGPLMSTEWGQGCYYNDDLETGCTFNCMHELTGCAATAMSQVMRYHEHPNNYDWANMLDDYRDFVGIPAQAQIDAVAELMLDVGDEIDMDWGCGSSAPSGDWEEDIPDAFTGAFGFSNCSDLTCYGPGASIKVKQNINSGNPLLFYGSEDRGAHLWVCDGYRSHTICWIDDQTGQLYAATYLHLWMNWGWNGDGNGWFGYSTWNGNFSSNQHYYYDIED